MARGGDPPEPPGAGLRPAGPRVGCAGRGPWCRGCARWGSWRTLCLRAGAQRGEGQTSCRGRRLTVTFLRYSSQNPGGRIGVLPSRKFMALKRSPAMVLSVLAPVMLLSSPAASSGNSALLYDYEFKGTQGTVINSAPTGPVALLTLHGSWSPARDGVHFSGDTSGDASVAYGRPVTGPTMNTPAGQAAGFGTRIVYNAPANGTCFSDTPNITQIGRFARHGRSGQVKIQLSSCADRHKKVVMECRFAGSLTTPQAPPVESTLPLINGDAYDVSCRKSPDRANNTATITLTVTRLNAG